MKLQRQPLPPTEADGPEPDPLAWNLIGMIDHRGGIGNAARANIRALKQIVGRSRTISFPSATYPHPRELPAIHGRNYLHFNPCSRRVEDLAPLEWFKSGRNIGFWAWETTRAPERWLTYDAHMAQIWVPSRFVANALLETGFKAPVWVVPHAVEPQERHIFPEVDQPLNFLVQWDGHSRVQRKRPDLAIKAITEAALKSKDQVHLIIKCHHDEAAHLTFAEYPNLTMELIDHWMNAEEMTALWRRTDVFVSLNRGEGFGLPALEAMARGIAVVQTGWGGSLEYMTELNSYPIVPDRLEEAAASGDAYFKTGKWALPCMEHAIYECARAMNEIRSGLIHRRAWHAIETAKTFNFERLQDDMKHALAEL